MQHNTDMGVGEQIDPVSLETGGPPATLIVGQSGGPTAAINSSLVGVIREAKAQGIKRIYGMRNGIRGLLAGDLVDLTNLPIEVLPALQNTPSAALGSCRYHLTAPDVPMALATLQEHNVHFMVYIGGNDSADTSAPPGPGCYGAGRGPARDRGAKNDRQRPAGDRPLPRLRLRGALRRYIPPSKRPWTPGLCPTSTPSRS
jgi:hypothetical protein